MATSLKVGDKVTCTAEYDVNGTHLQSWVWNGTTVFDVIQIGGQNLPDSRVVIGKGSAVTAAVDISKLTSVTSKSKKPSTPTVPVKEEVDKGKSADEIATSLLDMYGVTNNNQSASSSSINGSGVQYLDKRYTADDYNEQVSRAGLSKTHQESSREFIDAINHQLPAYFQNEYKFPNIKTVNNGYYKYDYFMNYYSDLTVMNNLTRNSKKSVNIDIENVADLKRLYTSMYNKYKIPNANDQLTKTFSHVFFVRPDCNIYRENSSATAYVPMLTSGLEDLSEFYYAKKHCPEILRQLTQSAAGYEHEFMLFPSNKVRSLNISDEYIEPDTYGASQTGYKIAYGKHNIASKTADKFSCDYIDDRDLRVYNLHKLWIDYISYVYRGKIAPKDKYMLNKVLDYATCMYYIVCAEDGETIIFWSKYWGVFPLEAPSSTFSFSADNAGGIKLPELKIQYQYSWKEDFNPLSLIEFNKHTPENTYQYASTYQRSVIGTGYTFGYTPFVETFNGGSSVPYTFKLRFRKYDPTKL